MENGLPIIWIVMLVVFVITLLVITGNTLTNSLWVLRNKSEYNKSLRYKTKEERGEKEEILDVDGWAIAGVIISFLSSWLVALIVLVVFYATAGNKNVVEQYSFLAEYEIRKAKSRQWTIILIIANIVIFLLTFISAIVLETSF